jgi:hypothetical protein
LAEVVLMHDRILGSDLDPYRRSAYLGYLRETQPDRNIPFIVLSSMMIVVDRRAEADLPGVRDIVLYQNQ